MWTLVLYTTTMSHANDHRMNMQKRLSTVRIRGPTSPGQRVPGVVCPKFRFTFTKDSLYEVKIGVGAAMTTFLRQRRANTADLLGILFSAGFMLVWLFCWPLYRLFRGHLLRG